MTGPDRNRPLLFNVYEYPRYRGRGSVWGSAFWDSEPRPPLIEIDLNRRGRGETTKELFFEIWMPRNQISLPPGGYISRFNNVHSELHYGYETGNNCNEAQAFDVRTSFMVEATVVEPTEVMDFAKAFSPATVAPGGISRLTFTLDNTINRPVAAASLAFVDDLPDGMVVAPVPNASNTCGSVLTAAAAAARSNSRTGSSPPTPVAGSPSR